MQKPVYLFFTTVLSTIILSSNAESADCIQCDLPGGGTGYASTANVTGAGVGGSPTTVAAQVWAALNPAATPTQGGIVYPLRIGATCGTACSSKKSECTTPGSQRCEHDFFADDIEQ